MPGCNRPHRPHHSLEIERIGRCGRCGRHSRLTIRAGKFGAWRIVPERRRGRAQARTIGALRHGDNGPCPAASPMPGRLACAQVKPQPPPSRRLGFKTGQGDMTKRKARNAREARTVVANDPEDRKGALETIRGPRSGHWNNTLANQAMQALWVKNSDVRERDRQLCATVAGRAGCGRRHRATGGGGQGKTEEQPRARQIAHAPEPVLRKPVAWFLQVDSECRERLRSIAPASVAETARLEPCQWKFVVLPGDFRMLAGEARHFASDRLPGLGTHRNPESACKAA